MLTEAHISQGVQDPPTVEQDSNKRMKIQSLSIVPVYFTKAEFGDHFKLARRVLSSLVRDVSGLNGSCWTGSAAACVSKATLPSTPHACSELRYHAS